MKVKKIYKGLKFSTKEINKNWILKIYDPINKTSRLVGVAGLIDAIGIDLVNRFVGKAFNSTTDVYICKLRRGLIIKFVSH